MLQMRGPRAWGPKNSGAQGIYPYFCRACVYLWNLKKNIIYIKFQTYLSKNRERKATNGIFNTSKVSLGGNRMVHHKQKVNMDEFPYSEKYS
jgi:hypothetical protein